MQTLTFALMGAPFAVPIESIKEIIEYPELTRVPLTSPLLRGVMNLRGSVIPVIDLATRFGLGEALQGRRTCVVIFELDTPDGRQTLGAIVDAVHEVIEIDPEHIDPPPEFGTPVSAAFLRGMLRYNQKIIPVLDLDHVLSMEQLESLMAIS